MKKINVLLTFMLISFFALSQDKVEKDQPFVQFGLKAGVNLANVETKLYPGNENRVAYHAGGLAHIHLTRHLALQPEVLFSSQGFKQQISSSLELKAKFDYINIPVMFQYMYRGFRLETGPQLGFLVNAKGDYSDGTEDDLKDYLKSTDFSWDFGASYLTPYGLGVHARYNLGISNINEKLTTVGITDDEINNRVWQFGVFYQFRR